MYNEDCLNNVQCMCCNFHLTNVCSFSVLTSVLVGMSHEVENLIQENTELLATKLVNIRVFTCIESSLKDTERFFEDFEMSKYVVCVSHISNSFPSDPENNTQCCRHRKNAFNCVQVDMFFAHYFQ